VIFAVITICVASQRVFVVAVHIVIGSVRKLLDTPSYILHRNFRAASRREKCSGALLNMLQVKLEEVQNNALSGVLQA
jgi:hypothetical protein